MAAERFPSLFQRYLATTIDVVLIFVLFYLYGQSPLAKTDSGAAALWPLWLFVIYEPVCNRCGTTLGQFLMGFRVRTLHEHRKVPLWRGFIRLFSKYVLGVWSFIRMPVHRQRRALHDIISGTIAIDARAALAATPSRQS
jgi:uncharacterized RDD family membrane protein YckC